VCTAICPPELAHRCIIVGLLRMFPPIMKWVADDEALLASRKSYSFDEAAPTPSSNVSYMSVWCFDNKTREKRTAQTPSGGIWRSSSVVHSYVNEQMDGSLPVFPFEYVGYPPLGFETGTSGIWIEASLSVQALGSMLAGGVDHPGGYLLAKSNISQCAHGIIQDLDSPGSEGEVCRFSNKAETPESRAWNHFSSTGAGAAWARIPAKRTEETRLENMARDVESSDRGRGRVVNDTR
jgi:hypothetical protein